MKGRYLLILLFFAVVALPFVTRAQQTGDDDRYFRLMSAQSASLIEIDGKKFRKCEGPARFLHNDTWLICDTALWDVDEQVIHAIGNVRIEQEKTELTSDKLDYYVERNIAEFRGSLVQLVDEDGNTLRTRHLDYNTKDSIAVFQNGGAMRDKDGQIIESDEGSYDAKKGMFYFVREVQMFTDSVFINTSSLEYSTKKSLATFTTPVDAWKDDNMLTADRGDYDRANEKFFFTGNVHLLSPTREGWSDSLYFERFVMNVEMLGNAQVTDSVRQVSSLGGRIYYQDSISTVSLMRDPLIIMRVEPEDSLSKADSVYFRADTLFYRTIPRCAVDTSEVGAAERRSISIVSDPVANIRAKTAKEAAEAAKIAAESDPNNPAYYEKIKREKKEAEEKAARMKLEEEKRKIKEREDSIHAAMPDSLRRIADSLKVVADSLALVRDSLAKADSLQHIADSIAAIPPDSTKIGFVIALHKAKLYRKNVQIISDSLLYNDLDSIIRVFKEPAIWNEGNHLYVADSIYVGIKDQKMDKADLMSNAFIHIKESEKYFDQIRGAEMMAYFDEHSQMRRFDALGTTNSIFFIKDQGKFTICNRNESTMMSADLVDGEINVVTYFESPKSDAYPIAQMTPDLFRLKGFRWNDDLRPKGPQDLSSRVARESQRIIYMAHPKADFKQTEKYFKGYMAKIYREIARTDSLRRIAPVRVVTVDSKGDTIPALPLLTPVPDSLQNNVPADSLGTAVVADTLNVAADSLSVTDTLAVADSLVKTPAQLRREAAEQRRIEREQAREKRWAELDERDAKKLEAKQQRKQDARDRKERLKKEKMARRKQKEDALLEKYKERYRKKMKKSGVQDFVK